LIWFSYGLNVAITVDRLVAEVKLNDPEGVPVAQSTPVALLAREVPVSCWAMV
jgi:hypothetical protein